MQSGPVGADPGAPGDISSSVPWGKDISLLYRSVRSSK